MGVSTQLAATCLSSHPASHRKSYQRPGELLRDLAFLARNLRPLCALGRGAVSAAFRERLMLVVTGVNRCRYCATFHGRLALRAGVPRQEVRLLLAGLLEDCPSEEIPALLYARHWAESNARPGAEAREYLRRSYCEECAAVIEAALHAIRLGNLLGNSWDRLLCRLSRGRRGCDPASAAESPAAGV